MIVFMAAWNVASNLAAPFLAVYLLRQLGFHWAPSRRCGWRASSPMRSRFICGDVCPTGCPTKPSSQLPCRSISSARSRWYSPRYPARHMLTLPLLYLIHVLMGAASGGIGLATGNLGLKLAPHGKGTIYLANVSLVGSFAGGIASIAGGALADWFASRELSVSFHWLSPGVIKEVTVLQFQHWEFLFAISAALGLYVMHALSRIEEGQRISERHVVQQFVLEAFRSHRSAVLDRGAAHGHPDSIRAHVRAAPAYASERRAIGQGYFELIAAAHRRSPMPHDISLITTIAAALGLALVMGVLAARLKLPPLVGYLLAGIIIGPATPGFVADVELAGQLAEIGVMLLMFGVGLHFSLEDLLAVRKIAVPGAIVQIAVATALGMGTALCWGWSVGAALVFGLALSVASTVVLLRALEDRGALDSVNGRIAVGWLVVEDLAMVLVLVLLPATAGMLGGSTDGTAHAAPDTGLWTALAITLGKVAAFIALMLVVGRRVFPKLLWLVAHTGSRELFTLCVIAAAVGVAYGSAKLFDVSFALGAFFAGHDAARIRLQPSRRRGVAAAARCILGAVLRLGRDAVRSARAGRGAAQGARRGRHHHDRQDARRDRAGAGLPLSAQHRAHGRREPGADRRVLVHPRRTGRLAASAAQ